MREVRAGSEFVREPLVVHPELAGFSLLRAQVTNLIPQPQQLDVIAAFARQIRDSPQLRQNLHFDAQSVGFPLLRAKRFILSF